MILEVEKKPKVALCRKCYGTGRLHDKETGKESTSDQCEATARVTVIAKMSYAIRP